MKVIFLDVDGVLNCNYSISRCQGCLGIDKQRMRLLKRIVDQTTSVDNPTKIVLTSTWKLNWIKYVQGTPTEPQFKNKVGKYMREKFRDCRLEIFDWTKEAEPLTGACLRDRGLGINKWLKEHTDVTNWVVLDDETFPDYYHYKIIDNLVLTNARNGITSTDCSHAIHILNTSYEVLQNEKGLSYLPCMVDFYDFICESEIWDKMKGCSLINNKSPDFKHLIDLFVNMVRTGDTPANIAMKLYNDKMGIPNPAKWNIGKFIQED